MSRACTLVLAVVGSALLATLAGADSQIYIAKAECRLFFGVDGELIKEYPCATGAGMCTPVRSWVIGNKRSNPGWAYRNGAWTYVGGAAIPMLGPLWMGLSTPSGGGTNYGIHGNRDASSIGKMASHGCIRMHNYHIDELYGIAETGTKVRTVNRVADVTGDVAQLSVFPIAYAARAGTTGWDLWLTNSAGQGQRRLTSLPGDERTPAWSPDGSEIAFVHLQGDSAELLRLAPETSETTAVVGVFATGVLGWSDEGLAYRDAGGAERLLEPGTGKIRPLTSPPAVWVAEDGQSVLLTGPDGKDRTAVRADAIRPKLPGAAKIEAPSLALDGEHLAFSALVGKQRDLFACRPDGTLLRNLTESPVDETDPAWSPVAQAARPGAARAARATTLHVQTDPPGLEIRVRPPGESQAWSKGRSPSDVTIFEPTPGGGEYEVIVRDPKSAREARATVWIAEGDRKSLELSLTEERPADDGTTEPEAAPEQPDAGAAREVGEL